MKGKIKQKFQSLMAREVEGEEGVTLIELLAVVVILAIIAVVAVPVVTGSIHKSRISTTEQSEATIAEALNRYAADHDGQFPEASSASSLQTALQNSSDGGPYMQSVANDAWGNAFNVTSTNNSFSITSTSTSNTITMSSNQSAPTVTGVTSNTNG